MKINVRVARIFRNHKAFYIGIFLLILLSSALYLSFRTASESIRQSVLDDRVASRVEDANFTFSRDLTDEEISTFENDFDLVLQKSRYVDLDYGEKAVLKVRPIYQKLNLTSVYEGEMPKNDGEVMVDRFFFDAQNLEIGKQIDIGGKTYLLTGILAVPDYLAMLKSEAELSLGGSKFGLAVMGEEDFDDLAGDEAKVYYSVRFSSGTMREFRNTLSESGRIIDWTDASDNNRISAFDAEIEAIITMSAIAPLAIMVAGCLIMAVVMGRMLRKEYSVIGTLSALGYRKGELFRHYLLLPVVISLVGSVVGLVGGYFLAEPLEIVSKMEYSVPAITLNFHWHDILTALLLPVTVNVLASSLSIFTALRIPASVLLKSNSGKGKKNPVLKAFSQHTGTFKMRFRTKEMLSNLPRSFLMISGICIASLFLLSGFIINSSVEYVATNGIEDIYGFEYEYIYNTLHTEIAEDGEPFLVSSFKYSTGGKEYGVTVNGIKADSTFIRLKNLSGESINGNKTVVSNSVASRFGWKPGDTVSLVNNSNLKTYSLTVDEIADINLGDFIYMDLDTLNAMLELPETAHVGLFSSEPLDIAETQLLSVRTKADVSSGMEDFVDLYRNLLYILAVFAAMIGIIVIYVVTVMLISENSKNISLLKILGYHNREISSLLLNSNTVPLVAGLVIGVPFSRLVMQIFFDQMTENVYLAFDVHIRFSDILLTVIFILTIYYFTLWLCRRRVLNVNMAESLKANE